MSVEVTPFRIMLCFGAVAVFLIIVGITIETANIEKSHPDLRDCHTCDPHIDQKLPMMESYLRVASRMVLPKPDLCNSCKLSIGEAHVKRADHFCVTWKKDGTAINSFEILIPSINVSCSCPDLFAKAYAVDVNAPLSLPANISEKFSCLGELPEILDVLQRNPDLTIDGLKACQSMAVSFNETRPTKRVRAKVTFSFTNFQFLVTANINKTLHLKKLVVRMSHMSPQNLKINCVGHPYYRHVCHCLENDKMQSAFYSFIKIMIPCALNQEEGKKNTINIPSSYLLLKDIFCFPDKPKDNKNVEVLKSVKNIFSSK